MAAFMLLDRTFVASGQVADRTEALQRGRQAMSLITRQLRSRSLHRHLQSSDRPGSNTSTVSFYADLSDGSVNAKKRTLTFDSTAGTITESVTDGVGTYPDLTFTGTPVTSTLLTKVDRIPDTSGPRDMFRYFQYQNGTTDGTLAADGGAPHLDDRLPCRGHQGRLPRVRRPSAYRGPKFRRARGRRGLEGVGPHEAGGGSTMRLIHRCQQGFTSITLMGVLLVGGLLVAASFTVVNPDIGFSKKDEDYKQANSAAEAGISYYLTRLAQDTSYYVHCTNVTPPDGPGTSPVNQPWNGTSPATDPRVFRNIPGSTSKYAVELLPITSAGYSTCVENNQASMIDASTGAFRIRSTGIMGSRKRSIVATLRRKGFIDFLYFTNRRTSDPSTYSSSSDQARRSNECDAPRQQRTGFCDTISFIDADAIRGPFHSNDSILVCGSPDFGVDANDIVELNQNSPGYFATNGCSAAPNFNGTLSYPSRRPAHAHLQRRAQEHPRTSTYQFNGQTRIVLKGDTMDVTYPGGSRTGLALPPNGVIYVNNVSCTQGYQRQNNFRTTDALQSTCGDVQVSGTYNKDITIGADNDIIVTDDLKRGSSASGAGRADREQLRARLPPGQLLLGQS